MNEILDEMSSRYSMTAGEVYATVRHFSIGEDHDVIAAALGVSEQTAVAMAASGLKKLKESIFDRSEN